MTAVDLDDLARRPQQYWDVDGLPELMMGLLWMLWGGALLFGTALPRDSRRGVYWVIVPAVLVLSGFASNWATKKLKARLTFPRTGYVEWKQPGGGARWGGAIFALLTAVILAAAIFSMKNTDRTEQMAAPVITVIMSLAFVVASIRQRAPHYLALAAVAAALALALGSMRAGFESLNWVFVLLGVASAAVGGLRLALFVRNHPRMPVEGA
jgi:hypothetical protein